MLAYTGKHPLTHNHFSQIKTNVNLMIGDCDKLVTPDENKTVAKQILNSHFEVLENGVHIIAKLNEEALKKIANRLRTH